MSKRAPGVPLLVAQLEKKIEDLESELRGLQRFVIGMPPPHLARLLEQAAYGRGDADSFLDKVVAAAEPLSAHEWGRVNSRALCPLCQSSSHAPYVEGYALPEGLLRHLRGDGNTRHCEVMRVLWNLEHLRHTSDQKWAEEKEQRERVDAAKRVLSDEPLYQTGPECAGQFASEAPKRHHGLRNDAQLTLTEGRLEAIGFEIKVDGRLHSYTLALNDHVVYADARSTHGIEYRIFQGNTLVTTFEMKDGVQAPRKKIEARLKKALEGKPSAPSVEEERQRSREALYKTTSECPGLPVSEARWYGWRDYEELRLIIPERLEALGFAHQVVGRVHSFTRKLGIKRHRDLDFVVYADPRMDDRVTYRVCLGGGLCSTLQVMDNWQEDTGALERRIASTLEGF